MANLTGTNANNTILGTANNDIIEGLGGNDRLEGRGGNDTLIGGTGVDQLIGGGGNDTYTIDNATEINKGTADAGIDTVKSSVAYTLGAEQENLTLTGSAVNGNGNALANIIIGNASANTLKGLGGDDTLNGGAGADKLEGGGGNDLYIIDGAGEVNKSLTDAGTDTVQATLTYTLGAEQEHLTLSGSANLSGTGSSGNNTLTGNTGNNALNGQGGNDTLTAGNGNDNLTGAGGNDTLNGQNGNDTLNGGTGDDRLVGGGGNDSAIFDALDTRGVDGGADTDELKVNGEGASADLATLNGGETAKFLNFEFIDLTATGTQTVLLSDTAVQNLNAATLTISVLGTSDDVVNATGDWVRGSDVLDGETTFHVWTKGEATIRVQDGVDDSSFERAPVGVDDAGTGFSTDEDSTFTTGNVLTNDTDANNDALTVSGADTTSTAGAAITNNSDGTFGYNPGSLFDALAVGETDTDTFTYTVSDGHGTTDTATVTIVINGANDAVSADDDAVSVDEGDGPTDITTLVLTGDADPDSSDTLSITAFSAGDMSGLAALVSGSLAYSPNGAFESLGVGDSATDTFTYTVSDGHGTTDTATVTVTVHGENDAVTAGDDVVSVNEDATTVNLANETWLLSNDTDIDANDILFIDGVAGGSKGTVTFDAGTGAAGDETVTYTADGSVLDALADGETTTDTFFYAVSDGHGTTDTATVTVTITGENDANDAVDDTLSVDEDDGVADISSAVLANDDDIDTNDVQAIIETGGEPTGTVTMGEGTLSYTAAGNFDSLAEGETTTDSFTYTISDGHGSTDTATVTVTITGENDAVNADDDTLSVDEDDGVADISSAVLANDDDVDSSDVKSITATSGTPTGDVTLVSGVLSYTAAGNFESLAEGETTTDSFTYTISDGHGTTDTATVTVTITGENDANDAMDDNLAFDEDDGVADISSSVLTNDDDIDTNDVQTITATGGTPTGDVSLVSGVLSYTAAGNFDSLAEGETTTDSFTYTISDGHGSTDTATVTVTITGENDAVNADDDMLSVDEGDGVADISSSVLSNDDDVDASDVKSITATSGTPTGDVTLVSGVLSYTAAGNFESLAEGETTTDSFTYTISDGHGTTDTATVTVTITGENDANDAMDDNLAFDEDDGVADISSSVLTNDDDIDTNDVQTITATGGTPTGDVSLVSGVLSYTAAGNFDSLADGETVVDTFTYTISDGHGSTDTATVTVTITGENDAVNADDDMLSVDEGDGVADISSSVLSNDDDVDASDVKSITATSGTPTGDVTLVSGVLSYTAAGNFESLAEGETTTDSFTYTISDGHGTTDTATVTVTITGENDANDAMDDNLAFDEDDGVADISSSVLTNDDDIDTNDVQTITATGGTPTGDVSLVSGVLSYTAAGNFDSLADGETVVDTFTYTISDGHGSTDTATVSVTVTGVNDAPVNTVPGAQTANVFDPTKVITGISVNDADNNALDITVSVNQGSLSLSQTTNLSFTTGDGTDDSTMTFTGALADINAALNNLVYNISGGGQATITLLSDDGAASDSDNITVNIVAELQLSSLNGTNGFQVSGEAANNFSGKAVSGAGDVNGDGFADIIIGAYGASPNGGSSGAAYVVFGTDAGFASNMQLSDLNGTNGFQISGESNFDYAGWSVSAAGDVNGDGIDDVIVGARAADPSYTGAAYVVFGPNAGFASNLNLSALNGTNGFQISGQSSGDAFGWSVGGSGDINGDGYDDVIVGATVGEPYGTVTGAAYVVFGGAAFASQFNVSSFNGTNGFRLSGVAESDNAGVSVSVVGDVNGDHFDDLFVGATIPHPADGAGYVVFGAASGFASAINLSALNGINGFKVKGEDFGPGTSDAGRSVSSAGDVNGDGFNDLVIGSPQVDGGRAYVVFGSDAGFNSVLELSALDGTNGFQVTGEAFSDKAGYSVSSAGDVNGDGYDDLLIGAKDADPNNASSGASYVVFGKAGGFGPDLDLSALNGNNGFQISGEALSDFSGFSVSAAGDVDGDGFDDLLIGARGSDVNFTNAGASYVLFGADFRDEAFFVGGDGNDNFTGNASGNIIVGGGGNDLLSGADGNDAVSGGSGDDTVDGGTLGNDKLSGGSGIDLLNGLDGVDFLDGGTGNDQLFGGAGNDRLDGGLGDDLLQGDGGQDDIDLGAGGTDTVIYTAATDGAAAGTQTGYDIVTGFQPGSDKVEVSGALQTALDDIGTANDLFTFVTDAAANFTTTHEAVLVTNADSGLTDGALVEDNWTTLLTWINDTVTGLGGVTATTGDDGLIIVQGDTQTGIYYYLEASGDDDISEAELTLLGIVNSQLTDGDFAFAPTS